MRHQHRCRPYFFPRITVIMRYDDNLTEMASAYEKCQFIRSSVIFGTVSNDRELLGIIHCIFLLPNIE